MEIHSTHKFTAYVGDIHGKFKMFIHDIKKYDISDTLIIALGDVGIGFGKPAFDINIFTLINEELKRLNSTLILFRGNHDDPSWFSDIVYDKIFIVSDYSLIHQNGVSTLMIGGGLSIDREARKESKFEHAYWEDELIHLNEEDEQYLRKLKNISIILSHMSPFGAWPLAKFNFLSNELLEEDTRQRKLLLRAKNIIEQDNSNKIRRWFYGHYHKDNKQKEGDIEYVCIAANRIAEIKL